MRVIIFFTISILFITGCTFSTANYFTPEFKVDSITLDSTLKNIVHCDHIIISGYTKNTDDKISKKLIAKFINSSNVPVDTFNLKALATKTAVKLRGLLKDTTDFLLYDIYFINQEKDKSEAESEHKEFILQSDEF